MNIQRYIRNSNGKVIGKIDEREIKDNNNKRLGYYDKSSNSTFDGNGKFVGFGDQRIRLI
jgi:hypothetical protein